MRKLGIEKILSFILLGTFFIGCGDGMHSVKVVTADSFLGNNNGHSAQGKALYENNCLACHGADPDQKAWGANFDRIKAAILVVSSMQQSQLFALQDSELTLISEYLMGLAGIQTPLTPTNPTAPNAPNAPYTPPSAAQLQRVDAFGVTGAQRLTRQQLLATAELNLGVSLQNLENRIPLDSSSGTYFSNDYTSLSVSYSIVNDYSEFASEASKRYSEQELIADIGCTPNGAQDFTCFENFVAKMGRRFYRRPLNATEIKNYRDGLMDYAQEEDRFMTAVELALEAMLQHPEFLYRLEIHGSSAGGNMLQLTQYEIATRMSFLILGIGPNDDLLDLASNNQLMTGQQREQLADELLADQQAMKNFNEFHGHWLGYGEIYTTNPLADDFRLETDKLIQQVNFVEKNDWLSIFNSNKTYVTPELAQHYGFANIPSSGWVTTTGEKQSGILTHASFAMVGRKFNDTSPTLRGYEIYKRLYCGSFDIPLPTNVDFNEAPGNPNDCKTERYAMRDLASCVGCHGITDGIGFGLENIDQFGNIRDVEPDNNQCEIKGEGDVLGTPFTGPREFATKVAQDPRVGACATRNLFEFMIGRPATADDEETLSALEGEYYETRNLHGIIKSIVRSEGMAHKRSQ